MNRWQGRVALVTGASVGIGAAIAERLVKHGLKVVGCARNVDKIQENAEKLKGEKGSLEALQCDLTKEDQILSMFEHIKSKYGGVDVCVNNAGLAHSAPLLSGETAAWKNMLDVNVLALCICTREAIKSMRERGVDDGHIVHISSYAAHIPPYSSEAAFYSATKAALKMLLEGHRMDLKALKSNIRVSAISPGLVETEFATRMRGEEAGKKMYASIKCLQADDIADAVQYVLEAPPHVQVHDVLIRPTEQTS